MDLRPGVHVLLRFACMCEDLWIVYLVPSIMGQGFALLLGYYWNTT